MPGAITSNWILLAPNTRPLQGRHAMSRFAHSIKHRSAFVVTCALAAFVWAVALSVSPQLHERIHGDANRAEHTCVVTAIASGTCAHTFAPSLVGAPAGALQFSKIPSLTPRWVESLFLKAHLFAHAPPELD
jgi:hypothetical protein